MSRGVPKRKEPDAIDVHVGRRIRMLRVWRDVSQMALAGAIGVTFQQVQKYEKGTNRVSASRLTDIAAVLDVTPSYFFEDMPDREGVARMPAVEKELTDFLSSAEGLALNRAFARIENQAVRRRFVGLVKSLAAEPQTCEEEDA